MSLTEMWQPLVLFGEKLVSGHCGQSNLEETKQYRCVAYKNMCHASVALGSSDIFKGSLHVHYFGIGCHCCQALLYSSFGCVT